MNFLRYPFVLAISTHHSSQNYINKPTNLISNENYIFSIRSSMNSDVSEEETLDLYNFLKYLHNLRNSSGSSNINSNKTVSNSDDPSWRFVIEHPYFASLFQVFIILLVCLFVVFVCKCNKIMFACRQVIVKPERVTLEEKIYNDKMTISDYLCISCKRCRLKKTKRPNKRFD
jgi:hypothetical protein